jgi:DNA-binding XRE family transcriptional regulator
MGCPDNPLPGLRCPLTFLSMGVLVADLKQRVLFDSLPTRKVLRTAIATIIRAIQLEAELSDEEMGRRIGVSATTVRNARNEDADLNALAIASIGAAFGEDKLQPYADLFNGQIMPRRLASCDPVPALASAITALSTAKTPKERADCLPKLRISRDVLNNVIATTEQDMAA